MMDDDVELPPTPPEVKYAAEEAVKQLLPTKSAGVYEASYERFLKYCEEKKIKKYSENALLEYFVYLANVLKMKSSSLWSHYSIIRTLLHIREKVDISKFLDLRAFLKKHQRENYQAKKSAVLTKNQFLDFLVEAPDDKYLGTKIVLLFGVAGALRCDELVKMRLQDIEDHGSLILIKVPDNKTNKKRSFTIIGDDWIKLYRKYASLRPVNMSEDRFFVKYINGKCTRNVMGIHKIGSVAKDVALFFKLPNWKEFTEHCLRRTSATVLADCGGDITLLKRHGGWKSDTVASGYIEESMKNKNDIATKILSHESAASSSLTKTISTINEVPEANKPNDEWGEGILNINNDSNQRNVIKNLVQTVEMNTEANSNTNASGLFQNAEFHNCTFHFNFERSNNNN